MKEKNISFIGLPASGKTTFLAALWHLIQSEEIECTLKLDGYIDDYPYLNSIHSQWIDGNPVKRTSLDSEQTVEVTLKTISSDDNFKLLIPDLSGEEFEAQLAKKRIKKNTYDIINRSQGVLLFLSANKTDSDIYLTDMQGIQNSKSLNPGITNWDYHLIPMQVKLVELLQTIISKPFTNSTYKIALIISAWDVVKERSISPTAWVEQECPLLHQFLQSNSDVFSTRIYGVSAQGGDLNDAQQKKVLTSMYEASKRIICCSDLNTSNDITIPLTWIIQSDD